MASMLLSRLLFLFIYTAYLQIGYHVHATMYQGHQLWYANEVYSTLTLLQKIHRVMYILSILEQVFCTLLPRALIK